MVEPQPSKLMVWVRSPSPATEYGYAHIAQAVEHFLGKEEVTGSSPVVGMRVTCRVDSVQLASGKGVRLGK